MRRGLFCVAAHAVSTTTGSNRWASSRSRIMPPPRKAHAASLNFLARVFGVIAILCGAVLTIWGLSLVLHRNATVDVDRVPTIDPWTKAIVLDWWPSCLEFSSLKLALIDR